MTYYYGVTHQGMIEQIQKASDKNKNKIPTKMRHHCFDYLARLIRKEMPRLVPSVGPVMTLLKSVVRHCNEQDKAVLWYTPAGFPVIQDNRHYPSRTVKTELYGHITALSYKDFETPGTLNTREQQNSISANFIHSLDASAMMLCVLACQQEGVQAFRMIHDSFATVPAHMDILSRLLRKTFKDIYLKDILKDFIIQTLGSEHPLINSIPKSGTLDLNQLLKAKYFFA